MCTPRELTEVALVPPGHWERRHTARILSLHGDYDPANTPALRESIDALIRQSRGDLILDLRGVTFIDASVTRVLISTRQALERRARRLHLRAPSPCARRILQICNMGPWIEGDSTGPAGSPSSSAKPLFSNP